MPGLEILLLGPPRVTVDGAPIQVDTRKAIALLALLAVDGPQQREALAALLWPDSETARARGALRRTLSVLSKALRNRWLQADRTTVALATSDVRCDVTEATALIAGTHTHADVGAACGQCIDDLRQAVDLYRGELLEGFGLRDSPEFDDWRAEREEHLRRELCRALDRLTRAEVARGDLDEALHHLERWLEIDGLNERVHGKLMLVHGWRGERAEAINRYRACVDVLDRELGVAPLPKTTQLYRAVVEDHLPPAPGAPRPDGEPAPEGDATGESTISSLPAAAVGPDQTAWPLVGRDRELAELTAASSSGGRLLVLTGEAGIGKTRLADELAQRLRAAGARVAAARCYPGEVELAFGLVVELLRQAIGDSPRSRVAALPTHDLAEVARLLPDLVADDTTAAVAPLDSPGAQARFFAAVWEVLEATLAGDQPGIVLVDELNAVDPASLDLLGYGLRRLGGRRLTVVVCLRREDAGSGVVELLDRPEITAITHAVALGRLDGEAVETLVDVALGDSDHAAVARRLHAESEGLPLLLVEYLRLVVDGSADLDAPEHWALPRRAHDLARSRLSRVSDAGNQVASAGAAIGRSFDIATVTYVSGRSDEELVEGLEELVARRLVRELPADNGAIRYDFVHDKLRAAIYDDTGLARRRLLHSRIADALATGLRRGHDAEGIAAVIGEHARLGGRDTAAAEWFALAGDHAQSLFANAEALAHYERALALGHRDSSGLHARIGELRILAGDYARALDDLEAAAAQADDPRDLAAMEQQLGSLHLRRGDLEAASAHLDAARRLAVDTDPALAARVEADLGLVRLREHDLDAAEAHAAAAGDRARAAADIEAEAQSLNLLGVIARHGGRPADARYHLGRSTALAERLDDPTAHIAALNNLALATADDGDVTSAIAIVARAVELGARRGDRHREAALRNNLADLLHKAGQEDDAMAELKRAVAIFADIGEPERPRPEIWKLVDW